jgi:hypothetical protein
VTFTDVLHAAQDTHDPLDYITRVKRVVQEEIESLDSTSVVESTPYFNHSAVPDFVVTWPGESKKRDTPRREVFLRQSYQSVADGEDERYLADTDAMILSLRARVDVPIEQPFAPGRILITDSEAIELVAGVTPDSDSGPLSALVRANFVRGARGHIDPAAATRLLEIEDVDRSIESTSAVELISASFSEDAAARINRTAQLIDIATGGAEGYESVLVGGRLSAAEMRHLLPWLLRRTSGSIGAGFWSYLGTLFDFAQLETIRHDLTGLDLTPLIVANADRWTATRAYIDVQISPESALSSDSPEEDGRHDTAPAEASDGSRYWGFHEGTLSTLSVNLGGRRLYIAQNGTLLKERPGVAPTPDWDRVSRSLRGLKVQRVDLHGIRRSVIITAEQSSDVQGDVEGIAESLDDRYFVNEVTLQFLAPDDDEGSVDVNVRFDSSIVVARPGASIADLATTALRILDFRSPAPTAAIVDLLGRSARAQSTT